MTESTTIRLQNRWIGRTLQAGEDGVRTISLTDAAIEAELCAPGGFEFAFVLSWNKWNRPLTGSDFSYMSHTVAEEAEGERTIVTLQLRSPEPFGFAPFAGAEGEAGGKPDRPAWGTVRVELDYLVYRDHPVIRKKLRLVNLTQLRQTIQHLAWDDICLIEGSGRAVLTDFFSERSASAAVNMDDSAVALLWDEPRCGLIAANEAPGAMKRIEAFRENGRLRMMYNHIEETVFETIMLPGETFESDASFLLATGGLIWQDAVDGPYRKFTEQLAVGTAAQVPSFTLNTWETFFNEVDEKSVLENIELAAELGFDSYQVDAGWHAAHGHFEPHPARFPNGLEPVVEACRRYGIRLGLWMTVPNVHLDAPVAREHPEWFARDENGDICYMIGWGGTGIMCLSSGYREWIADQIDRVVTRYGVELLKLDLASVRDPYQPGKGVGCCSREHEHRSRGASNLDLYRSMFRLMDEIRAKHPSCIVDLTYELYGVLHGTDLAHIQHAHQNWFINQNTPWIDMLRRMIHTRSRVVPAHTLNFGSCELTDEVSREYGFWSALTSHGLYYGDLRKLSTEERAHYRKWIGWVKEYRKENDFYRNHRVSDVFGLPDTPNHVDRRSNPYSNHEIARIVAHPRRWDGVAKLDERGEGLVLLFRPHSCEQETDVVRMPWMAEDGVYELTDVLGERPIGMFAGRNLHQGLSCRIAKAPGVMVIRSRLV